ncbi:MAG: hypothetical protein WCK60_02195 [Candidatus Nomurabacteria bacterium]
MSQEEARNLWSQKRCPFGVGDENGRCCTTECGAWHEWEHDTRKSTTTTETRYEDHRPWLFSDWYVIDSGKTDAYKETNEDGKENWHSSSRWYKWGRDTTENSGQYYSGGTCKRLNPG